MTTRNFIDHDTWFAQLPGVVVAAGALITDPAGRILLVKPNYRDHWTLPGGICERIAFVAETIWEIAKSRLTSG